jgi:hypothetical protein
VLANRRITVAVVTSLAIHALIFSIPIRKRPGEQALSSLLQGPMVVQIVPAQPAPAEEAVPVEPVPEVRPVPVRPPLVPRAAPREPPRTARAAAPPLPLPAPEPRATPQFDMMAAINARRERRRAAEAAAAGPSAEREPTEQESATATINRNLRTAPTEGVGGVFTILRKGTRTAEFSFNGWRPDSYRQWREVIEVDAGPGGDVERAIVRRMIELIRTHYTGDFRWESHNLGRVVILSARPEDNDGLEEFLIREFFGTPMLRR